MTKLKLGTPNQKINFGLYGVIACGILALWQGWWVLHPPSLHQVSYDRLAAFLRGDTRQMYSQSFDYERRVCPMTDAQLDRLSREFFHPKLALVAKSEITGHDYSQMQGQVVQNSNLTLTNGRKIEFITVAYRTLEGPRASFFSALLDAWYIEYLGNHKRTAVSTSLARIDSWLEGIDRDGTLLTELGLPGYVGSAQDPVIIPWREYREKLMRLRDETLKSQ